jgi:ABC-2 type transport system permease protein
VFELKQNFRSLVIWFIAIATGLAAFMALFPNFSSSDFQTITMAKMNALPSFLRQAFGVESTFNFQNILYFFAYMFQYFVIAIIVYSIIVGSSIISKEHEGKHIDYLATKPIRKASVVLAKYIAALSLIVAISVLIFAASFILVQIFNKTGNSYLPELTRLFLKMGVVYIFFVTISFFVSTVNKKTTNSSMLVIGLFFVSYVLGIMSKMLDKFANFKYLSPYFMFEPVKATDAFSRTDYLYVAGLLIACILMALLAVTRYGSKDLSLQ